MGGQPKPGEYEKMGFMPFVCFLEWPPEARTEAITRFATRMFDKEGKDGVLGLHGWKLIGRDTMIVIGWCNRIEELQKLSTRITFGTDITVEIYPAIDHYMLLETFANLQDELRELKFPTIPKPPKREAPGKTPKG